LLKLREKPLHFCKDFFSLERETRIELATPLGIML